MFQPKIDKSKFPWDRDIYSGREIVSVIEQCDPNFIDFYDIRAYVSPLWKMGEINKIGGGKLIKWHGKAYRLFSIRNHGRYLHHEAWTLHIDQYLAPHQRKPGILTPGNVIARIKTT